MTGKENNVLFNIFIKDNWDTVSQVVVVLVLVVFFNQLEFYLTYWNVLLHKLVNKTLILIKDNTKINHTIVFKF